MHIDKSSELILNKDHSVYHLGLKNEDIANIIITVGDPERVEKFIPYFDTIELQKSNREFHTITGWSQTKRITVLSTGIGTDNIDIVFNELNLLNKVDLKTRTLKSSSDKFKIVRIGTSGTLRSDVELGTYLITEFAIGLEGLMHYYPVEKSDALKQQEKIIQNHLSPNFPFMKAYLTESSTENTKLFEDICKKGITATCQGFYHPQSRFIFGNPNSFSILEELRALENKGIQVSNFEMETSGILGLSKYFGFEASSISLILANRMNNTFLEKADEAMQSMIDSVWDRILKL